jgi:hypothetical protein
MKRVVSYVISFLITAISVIRPTDAFCDDIKHPKNLVGDWYLIFSLKDAKGVHAGGVDIQIDSTGATGDILSRDGVYFIATLTVVNDKYQITLRRKSAGSEAVVLEAAVQIEKTKYNCMQIIGAANKELFVDFSRFVGCKSGTP